MLLQDSNFRVLRMVVICYVAESSLVVQGSGGGLGRRLG